MNRWITALALGVAASVAPHASAAFTAYTDSSAFHAAVGTHVVETFEGVSPDTLIPNGAALNGVSYFFNTESGAGGVVLDNYITFGLQALYAVQYDPATIDDDYFYLGESFSVVFPQPVTAAGIYISVGASDLVTDYVKLVTPVGTASSGGPEYDTGDFFFVGLISDTPFDSALFGATIDAPTGFFFDNLTYAPANISIVPTPAALPAGLALMALLLRRRRR